MERCQRCNKKIEDDETYCDECREEIESEGRNMFQDKDDYEHELEKSACEIREEM